jgi:hypothetical protein
MDPTSFRFLLTMPGDTRLVDVIRELTTQAATYAQLATEATSAFAQLVAKAAESAIAATGVQDAPIEFRFFRSPDVIRVTITWSTNGSEERREVEHRTSV